ncbi:hypothetical protein SAMD00019534_049420, partial [Acytostelium subglobosum LB1]|uniref:hypothetical protein n=1 Tax=Acytostelium subglobosum LB1 TaxID=1410327 RepID=UPI000645079C
SYEQDIHEGMLPKSLRSLVISTPRLFTLHPGSLPTKLKTLILGPYFDQFGVLSIIPRSLRVLMFGPRFNQALEPGSLPPKLRSLYFNYSYQQVIQHGVLPTTLQTLNFGHSFNQRIMPGSLPPSLKTIILSDSFNQKLLAGCLPESLSSLSFGESFNHDREAQWNVEKLESLGIDRIDDMPFQTQSGGSQVYGSSFKQSPKNVVLPSSLTTLSVVSIHQLMWLAQSTTSMIILDTVEVRQAVYIHNPRILSELKPLMNISIKTLIFERHYSVTESLRSFRFVANFVPLVQTYKQHFHMHGLVFINIATYRHIDNNTALFLHRDEVYERLYYVNHKPGIEPNTYEPLYQKKQSNSSLSKFGRSIKQLLMINKLPKK